VDFGELNDKVIKGLTCLSLYVSKFYLIIQEVNIVTYFRMNIIWLTLRNARK
jgi:hypothetical protein